MQARYVLLTRILITAISSCKKKDQENPVNYYPMTPGSYWVYENFRLDSNYQSTGSTGTTDSVYIEKDTTIAGRVYEKYMDPDPSSGNNKYYASFLRDSSGCLVDNYGRVKFTLRDFSTTFYSGYLIDADHQLSIYDTTGLLQEKMGDRDKTVAVPAGNFLTSSWQSTYTMNEHFDPFATRVRVLNKRYAAGVGVASETMPFYVSEPSYVERRLIRYKIK